MSGTQPCFPLLGFVLYGGTAIALRLGHRPSIDFDFFTDRTLNKGELYKAFPFLHRSTFLQETSDTITVLAASVRALPDVDIQADALAMPCNA
jgi:hypothetical protein